ncbi:amidohydrolase [Rhizorhabdus argentea]|uniref:amidohydrolase n=1 Tax=Rhizorhabdus argentea TaxID=1387174 RepID=UPI0030EEBCE0
MRLSVISLLAALAVPAGAATRPADTVLVHGVVLTVNARDEIAQALAIRDGRVVAVGNEREIDALIGPATKIIELDGHTVTPGLIDSHAHILDGAINQLFHVDLSRASTIAELLAQVKAKADSAEPGEWILGGGFNEGLLAEHRAPTLAELDVVSGGHPLMLTSTTGHYVAVNGVALTMAHIDDRTPSPPAGTIDRDAAGHATGLLKETAAMALVRDLVPPTTREQDKAALRAIIAKMHEEGMTGVKDPLLSPKKWASYLDLARSEGLSIHACGLIFAGATMKSGVEALAAIRQARRDVATLPAGDLGICGAKILLDGAVMARTSWMHADFAADAAHPMPTGHGYPTVEPDVYRQMVRLFVRAGVPLGTHVIGDQAIDLAVDAYADALKAFPRQGLRLSLIHAHIPSGHALDLMADLQRRYDSGIPEVQGGFLWWLGDALPSALGPDRSAHTMPFATYRKRGMIFAGGSDFPVTPLPARFGLWASVARQPLKGVFGAQPFGLDEAIDVRTALRSYTIWAARQLFIEQQSGSLEVGKWADIAVWDRNPYTVPTAALEDMTCLMTLYKGQVVFSR